MVTVEEQLTPQHSAPRQYSVPVSILKSVLADARLIKIAAGCAIAAIAFGAVLYFVKPASGSVTEAILALSAIAFGAACGVFTLIWTLKGIRRK